MNLAASTSTRVDENDGNRRSTTPTASAPRAGLLARLFSFFGHGRVGAPAEPSKPAPGDDAFISREVVAADDTRRRLASVTPRTTISSVTSCNAAFLDSPNGSPSVGTQVRGESGVRLVRDRVTNSRASPPIAPVPADVLPDEAFEARVRLAFKGWYEQFLREETAESANYDEAALANDVAAFSRWAIETPLDDPPDPTLYESAPYYRPDAKVPLDQLAYREITVHPSFSRRPIQKVLIFDRRDGTLIAEEDLS